MPAQEMTATSSIGKPRPTVTAALGQNQNLVGWDSGRCTLRAVRFDVRLSSVFLAYWCLPRLLVACALIT